MWVELPSDDVIRICDSNKVKYELKEGLFGFRYIITFDKHRHTSSAQDEIVRHLRDLPGTNMVEPNDRMVHACHS